MNNIQGTWIGSILGTNTGDILIEIQQAGPALSGLARINDIRFGPSVFTIQGTLGDHEAVDLTLNPHSAPTGVALGIVEVSGKLLPDGALAGKWESTLGTAGTFSVSRQAPVASPHTHSVFLVHGHDEGLKESVARFLEQLNLKVIILHEQPNSGRTVIEKFEQNADVDFAVILLTPDDEGYKVGNKTQAKPRARQNVVLELGYFIGRLGRSKICALYKGEIDLPSDIHGVVYEPVDSPDGWKLKLALELKQAGFNFDLNRII